MVSKLPTDISNIIVNYLNWSEYQQACHLFKIKIKFNHFFKGIEDLIPSPYGLCDGSYKNEYLILLKYIYENKKYNNEKDCIVRNIFESCKNNFIDTFKFLIKFNKNIKKSCVSCDIILKGKKLCPPEHFESNIFKKCCKYGSLEILKYYIETYLVNDEFLITYIMQNIELSITHNNANITNYLITIILKNFNTLTYENIEKVENMRCRKKREKKIKINEYFSGWKKNN